MILHALIVDDEEDVLEALAPGFVQELSRRLAASPAFASAAQAAGWFSGPSPRLNVKLSAVGYESRKIARYVYHRPVHLHLHLCCEKGGGFPHALHLLKEQFVAVVVSDLRFSADAAGARAGRLFVDDVQRRNPNTTAILYSAYQKPDGFPDDRFVRKGSAGNLGGEELADRMVDGIVRCLSAPSITRMSRELVRRGLLYQSDAFGAVLKRIDDFAGMYFGAESPNETGRRRPRPTLLLDGETGVGKTELAGLLHQQSERREHPFVSVACNQLTDVSFLRSILFGHVKGSFSGAIGDRPGLVESAGQGILLLDDLHKISDPASVILHSFLDDGEYCHLGQDEVRRQSKAAIVAAVETPKWEEIKAKQSLAESFLNRVEQLVVRIPPLRDRPEDAERQARVYIAEHSRAVGEEMELSDAAVAWLIDYGFPGGNSRKLRDFLKGCVAVYSRTTDYLDASELEEYARDVGMTVEPRPVAAPALSAPAKTTAAPAVGWSARISRLAAKALVDDAGVDAEDAQARIRELFDQRFPELWRRIAEIAGKGEGASFDVKLFEELLRCYAVYSAGNPAKAAKELGMKDNALREFIYSREQKRGLAEADE